MLESMATLVVANGLGSSALFLGMIGGAAGMFLEQTVNNTATTPYKQTNTITGDLENVVTGVIGNVVDDIGFLFGGGLWWYLGAAGLGAVTAMVTGELTNTMIFPIVASVVSGAGLGLLSTIL